MTARPSARPDARPLTRTAGPRASLIRALLAPAVLLCLAGAASAEGEDDATSVATQGDVVVHAVDRGLLAARFREVSRQLDKGDGAGAGRELADILLGDLDALVEERQGVYLRAMDAAMLRVAELPPEGLAAYRKIVDPQAGDALRDGVRRRDRRLLRRAADRMALSTHGPRLLVSLADLDLAAGDLPLAARALEELLRLAPLPEGCGVREEEVVSRLAATLAALGDLTGVRRLRDRTDPALLAGPSVVFEGCTLGGELARAETQASLTAPSRPGAPAEGPTGRLRLVAERVVDRDMPEVYPGREIPENPVVLDADGVPVLPARVRQGGRVWVEALGPPTKIAEDEGVPGLALHWRWPGFRGQALRRGTREDAPFAPARVGDLLLFPWPVEGPTDPRHAARFRARDGLVLLRPGLQPLVLDERGVGESERPDGDPVLERLDFCGRPLVRGDAVYVCLVGIPEGTNSTELHAARFDLVPGEAGPRLRLRWRRHLLDGSPLPDAEFSEDHQLRFGDDDLPVLPADPVLRHGRLYVAGNSGAVACLDAGDGTPVWLETYPRRRASRRSTVKKAEEMSWHRVPLMVDGPDVYVAPRDADGLARYAAIPGLQRSALLDWIPVRGQGTATEAGSVFFDLVAVDVAGVTDGWIHCVGYVPETGVPSIGPVEPPLVALRRRSARPGESERPLLRAQIPELSPAGAAAVVRGGLVLATAKGIYRVDEDRFERAPAILWTPPAAPSIPTPPDRLGNLVPAGRFLWSVTPSRIVLFAEE